MKRYRAWLSATATATVEFEADVEHVTDPDDRRDTLEDAAYKAFPGVSLCHQCAKEADLSGDWEIGENPDDIEEIK